MLYADIMHVIPTCLAGKAYLAYYLFSRSAVLLILLFDQVRPEQEIDLTCLCVCMSMSLSGAVEVLHK
jgi:hypothetical protein